jgi:hypothetical protein
MPATYILKVTFCGKAALRRDTQGQYFLNRCRKAYRLKIPKPEVARTIAA